jgi:hypothetical protein
MADFITSKTAREIATSRSMSVAELFSYTCQIRYRTGSGLRRSSIAAHISELLTGKYVIYDLGYAGPRGEYVDEYRFDNEAAAVAMRVCYSGPVLTGTHGDSFMPIETESYNMAEVYFMFRNGEEEKP